MTESQGVLRAPQEAEKDTVRLDWLSDFFHTKGELLVDFYEWRDMSRFDSLREAIDYAMAGRVKA